jgi:excisionase family DNA binding protein
MLKSIQQCSAFLGVGQSTVRRWIREGRVSTVRFGRRVLIRDETLKKLVDDAEAFQLEELQRPADTSHYDNHT